MSLSREQMREQMIDYLYGELKGEALARFEAALRESEQSRSELAALQATLRAARVELARDAHAQPPARVRDAVLKAAHAQLAAARDKAHAADAPAPLSYASTGAQPMAAPRRVLRWLRSVWILPSLVAATAAALLIFRQEQHTLTSDGPTASSSMEVVQPDQPPPSIAAEPTGTSEANTAGPRGAAEDSSSGVQAPQVEAPARSARKSRSTRGTSGDRFAAPPADWQRSPSADTEARAPTPTRAPSAPTRGARAPVGVELEAAERRESAALQTLEANHEGSALGGARGRTAAPAAAAPSTPASRRSAEPPSAAVEPAPPTPLTAARLEQRAREHAAATRWTQAAADYRELLRRFPQDPRRKLWTEQLELVLRPITRSQD